ncbi:acyloxyacyl hydrolase [Maribellus sp. YY47]|uniref:acyloxyacyl hydrolase n=1 Tax=Maribellus sp. YY47 TaxID=2929486 RepID=UPI002000FC31|nr:acyloxyacyl hydrolase [Maribellus sp. YY47]MCK3683295.1 acyloxyacyl hydrolase [Maribellus sp. YY47]
MTISKKWNLKVVFTLKVLLFAAVLATAQDQNLNNVIQANTDKAIHPSEDLPLASLAPEPDSSLFSAPILHQLGFEIRPSYILPTNPFLRGENESWNPIRASFSTHLKYAFRFCPNTYTDKIYGAAYQGIGLASYQFGNTRELGNPFMFYLFQGARISQISPQLSLNYEWNFGLSFGWKPYDYEENPHNTVIGSKANAYINTNFYFSWILSPRLDFNTGLSLTHFSNGNTKFPNAGLNTAGVKAGLVYNFNRENNSHSSNTQPLLLPAFTRHISYDVVLFGSWRRTGVDFMDMKIASPEAYPVLGVSVAPMYNYGYKLRLGMALDAVYDGSANVYTQDYAAGPDQKFFKPPLNQQVAFGISGRVEYVMPFFTVGLGLGQNLFHSKGDLKAIYQTLALKIEVTRSSFVHIGYCLKDFHEPNFLMLGVGFRLNNKYPTFYR